MAHRFAKEGDQTPHLGPGLVLGTSLDENATIFEDGDLRAPAEDEHDPGIQDGPADPLHRIAQLAER